MAVFAGGLNRIKSAYQLAQRGIAPVLIISPASRRTIDNYEKRFGKPGNAIYIYEKRADTTFMNALFSTRLIKDNQLKSVLLVTSDYHMPRSLFLLKLALLNTNCNIGIYKVNTHSSKPVNWHYRINRLKLSYNEMVQFWGSLIEGAGHYLGISSDWLRKRPSGLFRWLREVLLFDVGCVDCG